MSITTHQTIADGHLQADGRRYIRHEFTDHLGGIISVGPKKVDGAWTTTEYATERSGMVAGIETQLSEGEEARLVEELESGVDVLARVQAPTHSTTRRIVRKLIRHMMRQKNPYLVLALEPLLVYLRANYTGAQLKTFLNINTAQLQRLNTRVNSILNNKTVLTDFDANAEDIQ